MSTSRDNAEFARDSGSRKTHCVKGFQDWDLAVGHDGTNWYLIRGENAGAIVETRKPCEIDDCLQQYQLGEVVLGDNIEFPPGFTLD